MKDSTFRCIVEKAKKEGLQSVDSSFGNYSENYFNHVVGSEQSAEQRIAAAAVLTNCAIKIAKTDGKSVLESDDFKAALWLLHRPDDVTDKCVYGARNAYEGYASHKLPKGVDSNFVRDYIAAEKEGGQISSVS